MAGVMTLTYQMYFYLSPTEQLGIVLLIAQDPGMTAHSWATDPTNLLRKCIRPTAEKLLLILPLE